MSHGRICTTDTKTFVQAGTCLNKLKLTQRGCILGRNLQKTLMGFRMTIKNLDKPVRCISSCRRPQNFQPVSFKPRVACPCVMRHYYKFWQDRYSTWIAFSTPSANLACFIFLSLSMMSMTCSFKYLLKTSSVTWNNRKVFINPRKFSINDNYGIFLRKTVAFFYWKQTLL